MKEAQIQDQTVYNDQIHQSSQENNNGVVTPEIFAELLRPLFPSLPTHRLLDIAHEAILQGEQAIDISCRIESMFVFSAERLSPMLPYVHECYGYHTSTSPRLKK